ncbi:DUF3667 domain-containing protein [Aestuariivivens marinum]|uniref:DUF3667 domain-containing protein n=1 Tax=Aestuariivivens marinum TaxID=2913555 RepID=UPI001F5950B8|nr:DUF3667 domain-containing protein [Aestuariivivens marinum]
MKKTKETCKNCDRPFHDSYNFCPNCGQQTKEDLTVSVLFYNTISNYFSFDARFFKSFLPLVFKPGLIAKCFIEGKRLKYLHPAQFYLFISVVFFFIFSFKVREYNSNADKVLNEGFEVLQGENIDKSINLDSLQAAIIPDSILKSNNVQGLKKISNNKSIKTEESKVALDLGYNPKKLDSLIASGASVQEQLEFLGMNNESGFLKRLYVKQVLKFYKQRGGGIVQAFFDSIPIALFFMLPLFALILKLFYWRQGDFAYHLVFSFYFFSFLFIVLGFLIVVNEWILDLPDIIDWLIMLSTFLYLWLGLKYFYNRGYFVSLLKAGMVTLIYMSLIVPAALIVIFITSLLFY